MHAGQRCHTVLSEKNIRFDNFFVMSRQNLQSYMILSLQEDLLNLQIAQDYGLTDWIKYFSQHYPTYKQDLKQLITKKLSKRIFSGNTG
jgi:hypothetical protein